MGLNLLEGAHAAPERTVDQVVSIFHRLFAAFLGPRTANVLHAGLLTLAQQPGMTLCELPTLLVDESFRRQLVGRVTDPVALGPFRAWYENLSDGERAQAIGPVMNKLRAFLLRRRIRNVIGQAEATWTIEDMLNRRRVLLVSLAKGELGDRFAVAQQVPQQEGRTALVSIVLLFMMNGEGRVGESGVARPGAGCEFGHREPHDRRSVLRIDEGRHHDGREAQDDRCPACRQAAER